MRLKAVEGLELRTVGDEVLVHHPAAQKIHVLNQSAGEVLRLCDGTRDLEDIVSCVSSANNIEAASVRDDITRIVDQFSQIGLIREV